MKGMAKGIKAILIIFCVLTTITLIAGIVFPEQRLQQFIVWYRTAAVMQLFLVLACLRFIYKLQRFQRIRKENEKLKSDLEQNGVMIGKSK